MKRHLTDSQVALLKHEDEQKKLRKFASKITKVPETVQIYSNPNLEKKRE